ncbi:MAG: hypothetical protein ACI4O9_00465 [Akkermansia sp.]
MSRSSSLQRLLEQNRTQAPSYRGSSPRGMRPPLGPNTLAPMEELMERRRHPVAVSRGATNSGASLSENLLLLALLAGSIYGLYRLALYLLTQS